MMQKNSVVIIGCMLIFSLYAGILSIEVCSASGVTIYVDDDGGADYTKIQDAIDNASTGATVYVYSGIYYENIVVDVTIDLTGQDKDSTIIDGGGNGEHVVSISADSVTLSGFTIQNSGYLDISATGIWIESDYNIIEDNIVTNNEHGIGLNGASNNSIINNNIVQNNGDGIVLIYSSSFNNISGNTIAGMDLQGEINSNIDLNRAPNCIISNNILSKNGDGIKLFMSSNTSIFKNSITTCSNIGIQINESSNVEIFLNNFIGNTQHACDNSNNLWYNDETLQGNYWDSYAGKDGDGDWIGDTPYDIPCGDSQDLYPYINQNGWINNPPIADADGPYSSYVNQEIIFDGSDSADVENNIIGYQWDFDNDGTYDTEWLTTATTTHTYSTAGTYTVKLQVKDSYDETDTDTSTVTITGENNPPNANAGGPYYGIINIPITFDGSGSSDSDGSIADYRWDFGDGTTGTGVSPSHRYITGGNYTVTLVVTDDDGATDTDTTFAILSSGYETASEDKTVGLELIIIIGSIILIILLWCIALILLPKWERIKQDRDVEFCPCPYCGHNIPIKSTKCPNCGKQFKKIS